MVHFSGGGGFGLRIMLIVFDKGAREPVDPVDDEALCGGDDVAEFSVLLLEEVELRFTSTVSIFILVSFKSFTEMMSSDSRSFLLTKSLNSFVCSFN